jgi:hypothetical protein
VTRQPAPISSAPSVPSPPCETHSEPESYSDRKKSLALVYWISSVIRIAMQVVTKDWPTAEMLQTIGAMKMVCLFGAGCCRRDN